MRGRGGLSSCGLQLRGGRGLGADVSLRGRCSDGTDTVHR